MSDLFTYLFILHTWKMTIKIDPFRSTEAKHVSSYLEALLLNKISSLRFALFFISSPHLYFLCLNLPLKKTKGLRWIKWCKRHKKNLLSKKKNSKTQVFFLFQKHKCNCKDKVKLQCGVLGVQCNYRCLDDIHIKLVLSDYTHFHSVRKSQLHQSPKPSFQTHPKNYFQRFNWL